MLKLLTLTLSLTFSLAACSKSAPKQADRCVDGAACQWCGVDGDCYPDEDMCMNLERHRVELERDRAPEYTVDGSGTRVYKANRVEEAKCTARGEYVCFDELRDGVPVPESDHCFTTMARCMERRRRGIQNQVELRADEERVTGRRGGGPEYTYSDCVNARAERVGGAK